MASVCAQQSRTKQFVSKSEGEKTLKPVYRRPQAPDHPQARRVSRSSGPKGHVDPSIYKYIQNNGTHVFSAVSNCALVMMTNC